MYLGLIMLFYYVYQSRDTFCCVAKMQLGSPANPGWGHALGAKVSQMSPAINLALPAKMSDAILSYAISLNKVGKDENNC